MLEKLRNASKTWVAAILIGMLILQLRDLVKPAWLRRSARPGSLKEVGDVEIDQRTFEREFQQRIRRLPGMMAARSWRGPRASTGWCSTD